MAIGLTTTQRAQLLAMLPNIEESVQALKRLIADTKDRSRALQKLSDAEEAQKRHASDVGIPFNAEAFARRRAELDALPKALTVEDGQLSAFTALQRAIGIVAEGPYERAGRGAVAAARKLPARKSVAPKQAKGAARKSSAASSRRVTSTKGSAKPKQHASTKSSASSKVASPARAVATAAVRTGPGVRAQKPLPLSLGS